MLGTGALALLAWAMLWDRSRGRLRCPRCWYDMAGAPGRTCPECGKQIKGDRGLRRTRRRWRWGAAAAVLAMFATAAALTPGYRQGGWSEAVPLPFLILVLPLFDDPPAAPPTPVSTQTRFAAALRSRTPAPAPSRWESLRHGRERALHLRWLHRESPAELLRELRRFDAYRRTLIDERQPLVAELRTLLRSDDPEVRAAAASMLGAWGAGGRRVVRALTARLDDEAPAVRRAAALALSEFQSPGRSAIPSLVRRLNDEDPRVREAALTALGNCGPPLARVLEVATAAAERGLLGEERVFFYAVTASDAAAADTPARVAMLRHEHWAMRMAGAYSLWIGGRSPAQAKVPLVAALDDPHAGVRLYSLLTLEMIGKGEEIGEPALRRATRLALGDPDEMVRGMAVRLLSTLAPEEPGTWEIARAALRDEHRHVRLVALRSYKLRGVPAAAAIPDVEKLLEDPDPVVREAADAALRALQGRPQLINEAWRPKD